MVNFFNVNCQQNTSANRFGICDFEGAHASIIDENPELWIAVVLNDNQKNITLTAIDNCIEILRENGEMESSCDGMLTYDSDIDFFELKVKRENWIQGGIQQLVITVGIFFENNNIADYRRKRAFLANKKHPQFKFSHKEDMQKFKNRTGIRLIITNEIKI